MVSQDTGQKLSVLGFKPHQNSIADVKYKRPTTLLNNPQGMPLMEV